MKDADTITITQPALHKYRTAVFAQLAERTGKRVRVICGGVAGGVDADDLPFELRVAPLRTMRVLGHEFYWFAEQIRAAADPANHALLLTWNSRFLSLLPAMRRARRNRVPVVLWGHAHSKREGRVRRRLRNWFGQQADALLCYDNRSAERLRSEVSDPQRVFVAQNALDQQPIQQARQWWLDRPDELQRFQQQRDLTGRDVVLFVSRLTPENRLDLLIEAAAALRDRRPNLCVVIIGGNDEEKSRLEAIAGRLNVGDVVRFIGPEYGEPNLAPWFLSAKVYGYPANIGLSLLHAFGYGLPVVTSDRLDLAGPEITAFEHEGNGLVFAHGDAAALAETLGRLLADQTLRQALSRRAHETVMQQFTVQRMVDGMVEAIACARAASGR